MTGGEESVQDGFLSCPTPVVIHTSPLALCTEIALSQGRVLLRDRPEQQPKRRLLQETRTCRRGLLKSRPLVCHGSTGK